MEMKILSRKFVKPCKPTPHNLKSYKISLLDEMFPLINVAVILFYSKLGNLRLLEEPVGADFVEAQADCGLHEFIKVAAGCGQLRNDLLPCELGAVGQITDPLLSIQVTKFKCGGHSIGVCVSHKVFDASSLSTLIVAWAADAAAINLPSRDNLVENIINPSFDSVSLWPGRNLESMDCEPSRKMDLEFVNKRILFNNEAVKSLKNKMNQNGTTNHVVSRVCVVCAFQAMVLTRIDRSKEDEKGYKDYIIAQAVNIRGRTIPPMPKHSCGNLVAQAFAQCLGGSDDTRSMKFEDYFNLLGNATQKTVTDCGEIFGKGDEGGCNVIADPKVKVVERIRGGEVNALWFSDWSKFGFYEVDFGWGKPIWCSFGSAEVDNLAILIDNKEGDGIEAYVCLHKKFMDSFEQQQEIRLFVGN